MVDHLCFEVGAHTSTKPFFMSKNYCRIQGNLGKDPELRELADGKKFTRFSVATTESYKDRNGQTVNETVWHDVVAWGKLAETSKSSLAKGNKVIVEGKLNKKSYKDANGNDKQAIELVAKEIIPVAAMKTAAE